MVAASALTVQSRSFLAAFGCLAVFIPSLYYVDTQISEQNASIESARKLQLSKVIEIVNNRAVDRAQVGNYYGSIEDCNLAAELDPTYPFAYRNPAFAEWKLGQFPSAICDIEKAITFDPDSPFFRSDRAQILADAAWFSGNRLKRDF